MNTKPPKKPPFNGVSFTLSRLFCLVFTCFCIHLQNHIKSAFAPPFLHPLFNMHSTEIAQSSSASDSSRSGSPDTRATTPSSDCQEHPYLPVSYACFEGDSLTPNALKAVFSKHSSNNRLGLILVPCPSDIPGEWTHQRFGSIEYFVSSSYVPTESEVVCCQVPDLDSIV